MEPLLEDVEKDLYELELVASLGEEPAKKKKYTTD
jgi:hypothetical protein